MKKYLQLLPSLLFPYYLLFTVFALFSVHFAMKIYGGDIFNILISIGVFYLVALICSVITFIVILKCKFSAKNVFLVNMIIKLIQVPAYILIFIIGALCFATIFTMGIAFALILFDMFSIVLTGLIGGAGAVNLYREGKVKKSRAVILFISQFVFCIDVAVAIALYVKERNSKSNVKV